MVVEADSSMRMESSDRKRPLRKLIRWFACRWPIPVKAKISSGREMYVDLRSPIGRAIYMKGEFDPNVFEPFRAVLRPGDTFIDVGANVGYYSMLALDIVLASGRVHVFEVDERALRCLRKTKQSEHLDNLTIHAAAVGDRDGTAHFFQEKDSGHSHLTEACAGRQVKIMTLDSWSTEAKPMNISAIKVDIEGAEILALRGARRLIEQHRPVVVCEVWNGESIHSCPVADFLHELGYTTEALADVHSPIIVGWP